MVDVERAVQKLRTVRRFRPDPISDADLHAILQAGRRSGSSKNLQRWRFIVVRQRDRLRALAGVGPFAGHLAVGVVAIAIVTPDPAAADSPLSVTWDSGRAAQNMMLVALARGIGSVPATVYDHDLCRKILGYPPDQHCEYLLDFGRPASAEALSRPLRAGGRQPLEDLVYYERWGDTGRAEG